MAKVMKLTRVLACDPFRYIQRIKLSFAHVVAHLSERCSPSQRALPSHSSLRDL